MHGISAVAGLALLGLTSAAPAKKPQVSSIADLSSFVVSNVATGKDLVRDGPAALSQALGKYGFTTDGVNTNQGNTVTPSTTTTGNSAVVANNKASAPQAASTLGSGNNAPGVETGEVDATSQQNDLEYTTQIQVGGQTIQVNFDTGSADLWLFNTKMQSQYQPGHTLYNPDQSSTFKQMQGSSFAVHYGDGTQVSGNIIGTDKVNVGGADFDNQVIELADVVAPSFANDKNSHGLVGLGFSTINTVKPVRANTFIENVAPQLKEPVFTANLKHAATGSYEFGNIDRTSYNGDMVWVPIDKSKGLWQFTSNFYQIGNSQPKANSKATPAIADTGTSLLLMDPAVVNDYYAQVKGAGPDQKAGGIVFPCNAQLPDLNIGIAGNINGGKLNNVPGNLINYSQSNATHCFGALQSNSGGSLQILGDPLFKSSFVAFHIGNSSLGFAQHAN